MPKKEKDKKVRITSALAELKSEVLAENIPILIEYFLNNHNRYLDTLQHLDVNSSVNKKILDVGILPGHMGLTLQKLGFAVDGISFGKRVEEICAHTLKKLRDRNITVIHMDIEKDTLPCKDNTYDYIIFTDVIEHLSSNILGVMKELRRVLKPEGRLILSTPNVANIGNRIEILKGRNIYWQMYQYYERDSEDRHNREFTLAEVKDLLRRTGFEVKEEKYFMHMPEALLLNGYRSSVFKFLKSRFVYFLAKIHPPFRSLFLIVAQKKHGTKT